MQGAIQPEFFQTYSFAQLQAFSPRELESCGRIATPLLLTKGSRNYRPIEWDEALDRIETKLKQIAPRESFWYFSGRSSNEAGFLLQLLARLYGTNNVNNCSYYCHQASGVGLAAITGHRHRHGLAGRRRGRRPGVSDRRQPGQQSSAADAHADAGAPQWRRT